MEVFTTGSPLTNTIVITAEIESGFVAKDDLIPFRCSLVSLCVAPLQTGMTTDEGVHCMRAFLTMWRPSRRLVCKERSEPGLRVNDTSWIE
ncbi:hypothetical protein TNCV_2987101 [Trichonephila clavipes]|nr:hypothetical protein TNCV_2987101 [Trichonephila clavipes]